MRHTVSGDDTAQPVRHHEVIGMRGATAQRDVGTRWSVWEHGSTTTSHTKHSARHLLQGTTRADTVDRHSHQKDDGQAIRDDGRSHDSELFVTMKVLDDETARRLQAVHRKISRS